MLTAERLREVLDYNPETGVFTWRVIRKGVTVGSRAGTPHSKGYRTIRIDYVAHYEHVLAWLHTHGVRPTDQLDHRNRVRNDNRLSNLRPATGGENNQNVGLLPRNTSGHPGVSWDRRRDKWAVRIGIQGRQKHVGYFTDLEEAAEAYRVAKAKYHTFHPETRK